MNEKSILNKVRTLLGMEVKLETMRLSDGVSMLEAESFEAGQPVFILTEDEQRIPLPVGEYELEDMRVLVVIEEGVIADVREAAEPEVEVEVEVIGVTCYSIFFLANHMIKSCQDILLYKLIKFIFA